MNGKCIYDLIDDNVAKYMREQMVLSDSQISMKSICFYLLFTPVDYIFVICLTKCLSWLVGVLLRACSTNWFCIIISLLFYYSEDVIPFWVVTWALGLKKCLKSRDTGMSITWERPNPLGCWQTYVMRASRDQVIKKFSGTHEQASWSVGMVLMGPIAGVEDLYIVILFP